MIQAKRPDVPLTTISVIVGSIREGRFAEKPAHWIHRHLQGRSNLDARLLDLRDFPMPFFAESEPPLMSDRPPYANEVVRRWTAEIARSDGFIVVCPEYNHGYPAVLKNAFDYVYQEWNRKPIAFVAYSGGGGANGVQQLRQVAVELQMTPIRPWVRVSSDTVMAHFYGGDVDAGLTQLDAEAGTMIDDLLWWTSALTHARTQT